MNSKVSAFHFPTICHVLKMKHSLFNLYTFIMQADMEILNRVIIRQWNISHCEESWLIESIYKHAYAPKWQWKDYNKPFCIMYRYLRGKFKKCILHGFIYRYTRSLPFTSWRSTWRCSYLLVKFVIFLFFIYLASFSVTMFAFTHQH